MNAHAEITAPTEPQHEASTARLCDILLSAQGLVEAFDTIWTHGLIADIGGPILTAARDALDEAAEVARRLHAEIPS